MLGKRLFDLVASLVGLVALAPLLLLLAAAIKLDTPGPVFFRQERVGRHGRIFLIHKFRTMATDAERRGLQITVGADPRVTRVGAKLRKYKFDELPQLIDVALGHMSLVGPRPEVPRYVAQYPENMRRLVLSVKPGITDWASIEFRNENDILNNSSEPDRTYVEQILPVKLDYYAKYVRERSFIKDIGIILRTLRILVDQ